MIDSSVYSTRCCQVFPWIVCNSEPTNTAAAIAPTSSGRGPRLGEGLSVKRLTFAERRLVVALDMCYSMLACRVRQDPAGVWLVCDTRRRLNLAFWLDPHRSCHSWPSFSENIFIGTAVKLVRFPRASR